MKLKASFETECFLNDAGYYAIKQDVFCPRCDEEHSAVIQLTPDQMEALINDMHQALENTEDWFYSVEQDE